MLLMWSCLVTSASTIKPRFEQRKRVGFLKKYFPTHTTFTEAFHVGFWIHTKWLLFSRHLASAYLKTSTFWLLGSSLPYFARYISRGLNRMDTTIALIIISKQLTTYTIPFDDLSKLSCVHQEEYGPRTEPWGTLQVSCLVSENDRCTVTRCDLFARKNQNHRWADPMTLNSFWSLCSNMLWSIGLNAVLKSRSTSRTKPPPFALQRISLSTRRTAVSVLCPSSYADADLLRRLCIPISISCSQK